jgi:microcystin-dependent protein
MSTSPIVITPSTSVVLINTADFSGNPVVLLPNLTSAPGVIGRIITIRDNDGGSVVPAKSIYISTTGGARFQSELSSITLSTIRITQPYGFITLTPRLTDGSGNTNYGLMNVYAFPDASPAAYVNTLNANFSYLSTLSTVNLAVSQNTFIQGNLTVNGTINYANPGTAALGVGTLNANTISAATILNRTFNGVNINASTINTSTFVARDSGSILLPNANTWSNASAFAGTADPNSLNLGTPAAGAGAQIGLSSNFFGIRAFTKDSSAITYSTTMVMRDRNVAINPASITGIGVDGNPYSDYRLFVTGSTRLSNQGLNNNTVLLKQAGAAGCNFEANEFGGTLGTFRMDTSSNITEGFFGAGLFANQYKWMSASKAGSIQFFTGISPTADTSARVTIDNTGLMGVGTSAPAFTLDVSGSSRMASISTIGISSASVTVGVGSASAPSYSFGGDTNNGIFAPVADNVAITTGGTERLRVDNVGRLGVGTSAPAFTLDVSGSSRMASISTIGISSASVTVGVGSAGAPSYSFGGDTNNGIFAPATDTLAITTAGLERLRVDSAGRVGIGLTPASGYALDVSGGNIQVNRSGVNAQVDLTAGGGTLSLRRSTGTNGNVDFVNSGTGLFSLYTNNTARFSIDSNGNVGIGSTTPTTQLTLSNSATNALSVVNSSSRFNVFGSDPTNGPFIGWTNSMPLRFATMSDTLGGTITERMRITNDGIIGIGTTTPFSGYRVDISGNLGLGTNSKLIFLTENLDNKISLWGGSNSSVYFGFGVRPQTLLYNVPDFANSHVFYASTTRELMRITGAGQVGIACVPNTSYNLDVSGNSRINNGSISFDTGSNNGGSISATGEPTSDNKLVYRATRGNGGHIFNVNLGEAMRITFNGNIGINTSTPTFKLDVSGDARITSNLTVNGSFNITPAGSIMIWSTNTAPSGWLLCDGTSYSTTAQATLFAVIAYTYGGSGANFNVPNMKQRVPVGRDTIDASFNTIGYTSGAKTHTLTEAEMPSHTHDYKFPSGQATQGGGGDIVAEDNFSLALTKTSVATGGGGAHNNMQPYMVLNYIIKT